jgi:hypothetical protein
MIELSFVMFKEKVVPVPVVMIIIYMKGIFVIS